MVIKSYGKMRGTRTKLKRKPITINRYLRKYEIGEPVSIQVVTQRKMPDPKWIGKPGKVIGKRGKSYIIQINDKNAVKQIIVRPEHLAKQG